MSSLEALLVGGGGPLFAEKTFHASSGTDGAPRLWTGVSLGKYYPTRKTALFVGVVRTAVITISSVKIHAPTYASDPTGVAATVRKTQTGSGTNVVHALYTIDTGEGTAFEGVENCEVRCVYSISDTSVVSHTLAVVAYNGTSVVPTATASSNSGDPMSINANASANGIVLAAIFHESSSNTNDWLGTIEELWTNAGPERQTAGGAIFVPAGATPYNVQDDVSSTSGRALIMGTFVRN